MYQQNLSTPKAGLPAAGHGLAVQYQYMINW